MLKIACIVDDDVSVFELAVAAEGTRSKVEYWKSGFYRLSQQTGLPICLAYMDGPSRTVGAAAGAADALARPSSNTSS